MLTSASASPKIARGDREIFQHHRRAFYAGSSATTMANSAKPTFDIGKMQSRQCVLATFDNQTRFRGDHLRRHHQSISRCHDSPRVFALALNALPIDFERVAVRDAATTMRASPKRNRGH